MNLIVKLVWRKKTSSFCIKRRVIPFQARDKGILLFNSEKSSSGANKDGKANSCLWLASFLGLLGIRKGKKG